MFRLIFILMCTSGSAVPREAHADPADVPFAHDVQVTILSSNLADGDSVGEWGFSALVESDGRCVLFDAGRHSDTVIRNVQSLKVDLSCVDDVVLSHFHFDHNGGLFEVLEHIRNTNPDGFARLHVAEGFFRSRRMSGSSSEANQMIAARERLIRAGVQIIEHTSAAEILPAIWVTGPVERIHPEKTYPTSINLQDGDTWITDFVPESQGLVVTTASGPVVLLGCGHSGSVNLLTQVRSQIQNKPIHALMGGMHLYAADDATLRWTADKLNDIGLQNLMAGHCTGVEPLVRLRADLHLDRSTAVIGSVGSRFVLGQGIKATAIAK
jgi:7,8-dihydropterin-6-yl-methyl-4-(beta-D-ribofuranosyl)aminobenzene 5'-phosphate synthase